MNDADFARAVHRAVASHRKIFKNQERHWAAVRLRANLLPARVAAERVRLGVGASDRTRSRVQPVVDRGCSETYAPEHRSSDAVFSVSVKRFRAGPCGGELATRSACALEKLPRVDAVPPYSSYQYSPDANAFIREENKRRLMYADQEGEMRVASDAERVRARETPESRCRSAVLVVSVQPRRERVHPRGK
jgi:hypothetical protein